MTEPKGWSVHLEYNLSFDLNEEQIARIANGLGTAVSWDILTMRLSTTLTHEAITAHRAVQYANTRVVMRVLTEAGFKTWDEESPPIELVAVEALTFAEQDKRLRLIASGRYPL